MRDNLYDFESKTDDPDHDPTTPNSQPPGSRPQEKARRACAFPLAGVFPVVLLLGSVSIISWRRIETENAYVQSA